MIRRIPAVLLTLTASTLVFAQAPPATPSFEVASIKPAAPQTDGRVFTRMGGDAGRIDYANVGLRQVLTRAYNVKPHQITGPSWLDSERFDITAKIPEGVSTDQIPVMLQNLLTERFKMTIRRETKEQPVYALVVGKNGPKLTKAKEGDDAEFFRGTPGVPVGGAPGSPPAPPPPGAITVGRQEARGGGGGPAAGAGGRGAVMMSMGPGGGGIQMRRMTLPRFADMLSNFLDRPVIDKTEIQGEYDIKLDVSPEELRGSRMMRAMPAGGPPPGAAGPQSGPAPEAAPSASIFTSIQQLGLKLESRKAPIEYIVIEKADKVPTEN